MVSIPIVLADVSQILTPFGFTSLESEIYTFLLKESPATGYKIARAIGKATANTYKAIESLQQKGAVVVDEGANRMCRAVGSDELLARLTRDFEWKRASAEMELSRLTVTSRDDGIYSLKTRAQALERARRMLNDATDSALIVARADTASQLRDSVAHLLEKKVRVFLLSDATLDIRGLAQTKFLDTPLNELQIVTDASELLLVLFGNKKEEVLQAIWTQSTYLAALHYRSITARSGNNPAVTQLEETKAYKGLLKTSR